MRTIFFFLFTATFIHCNHLKAQNHFPATGNAGVGTGDTPMHTFEVRGVSPSIGIRSTNRSASSIMFQNIDNPDRSAHFAYFPSETPFFWFFMGNKRIFTFTDTITVLRPTQFEVGDYRYGIHQTINAPDVISTTATGSQHMPGITLRGINDYSDQRLEMGIGEEPWIGTGRQGFVGVGEEHKLRLTSHIKIAPRSSQYHLFDIVNNGQTIFHVNRTFAYFDRPVGIGTNKFDTRMGYMLYVKGGILAEALKINIASENGWGDYVFYDDYKLKSLDEVERFIAQNKHLPEIPSAKVIDNEGVEIGEMVRLQMIKIEELTLYIIEQNKKLQAQSLVIKEQHDKLEQLDELKLAVEHLKNMVTEK